MIYRALVLEIAYEFDSSVTEWKHETGYLDNPAGIILPETPSYDGEEEACHSGAEEQGHSCDQVGTSTGVQKVKLYGTRFFIIKSLNHQNIQLSTEKGIWATQVMNEPILDEAFHNSGKVILIFSVNMSGFFQGYAQMMSSVGWRRDDVWSQGSGGSNPWGRSFKVKWLRLHDLPFQKTLHLKNPLNHYKPVKISRDCQELSQEIGEALCELLDGKFDVDDKQKRYFIIELKNEGYNVPPIHMGLSRPSMLYPSLVYQQAAEASKFHLAQQRPAGKFFPVNLPINSGGSKVVRSKYYCIKGNRNNVMVDSDSISQLDVWGLCAERSPVATALTEDDILEMVLVVEVTRMLVRNKARLELSE
ncbi:hypothetical protein RJ639_011337 [Escallonia herrerae]|uniref:YTH domain-containing family protein n=1 Tax=Escallonia herrerae TaxID=1293975 RepID=A0AA88VMU8_9ASTE|nr:hypothetical protein RJ639_011337 [Escallonia herrerae]